MHFHVILRIIVLVFRAIPGQVASEKVMGKYNWNAVVSINNTYSRVVWFGKLAVCLLSGEDCPSVVSEIKIVFFRW